MLICLSFSENCSCILGSCTARNLCKKGPSQGSTTWTWPVLNIQIILLALVRIWFCSLLSTNVVFYIYQTFFHSYTCSLICRLVGACVLIVYMAISYGMYVPDWHFTIHNIDSADYGKVLTVSPYVPFSILLSHLKRS